MIMKRTRTTPRQAKQQRIGSFRRRAAANGGGTYTFLLAVILSVAVIMDTATAFGMIGRTSTSSPSSFSKVLRGMLATTTTTTTDGIHTSEDSSTTTTTTVTEQIAQAVDGEVYADGLLDKKEVDSVLGATDKLLSKRVPVAIRYSADSGMKPYFLTVAKKLKEEHPDIILDKVILPKVEVSGGGDGAAQISRPTFEVMVDGKVVIPTVGKKDRDGMGAHIVFVSMQELEVAITRARRRRRPSTVYGEEEANVRLEMLKIKAALVSGAAEHPATHKQSKD